MNLQLNGKKALITGSSKGIGEAIARKLAGEGATVIVHGRDGIMARQVVQAIVEAGGKAFCVLGDLTEESEVFRMLQEAEAQAGKIDILINNAGGSGGIKDDWTNTNADIWLSAYDRNVLSALRLTTKLLPAMRHAKWGRIVNISSLAATITPPTGPGYAASKAALNAMTASLAKAVAADGVTVNAISPGTIHSAALDKRFREVAVEKKLAAIDAEWETIERAVLPLFAHVPIGRVGRLEEVADAVAFLTSPLASYITGSNLRLDGGISPVI